MLHQLFYYRIGLLACFCCAMVSLWGQAISPEVDLRDSSQLHLLRTRRGDRLIGRLLYVQPPEASFRMRTGDTLFFDLSSLKAVSVLEPPATRKTTPSDIFFADLFISNTAY